MGNRFPQRYDDDEIQKALIQRERRCRELRDLFWESWVRYLPALICTVVGAVILATAKLWIDAYL